MRSLLFILTFCSAAMIVTGQNLVPNAGFDQNNGCPKHSGQISLANFWFSPNNTTPDYFNDCSTSFDFGTEFNTKGGQVPHSGKAYAGIQVFNMNHNEYYEYLESRLDSPLTVNQQYCIRAWVSLGQSKYALEEFGAVFSVNEIKSPSPQKMKLPYTILRGQNPLSDADRWMCIQGIYTAKGGERFLTFGDFSTYDNFRSLQIDSSQDTLFKSTYYFIDDLAVEPVFTPGSCTCPPDK